MVGLADNIKKFARVKWNQPAQDGINRRLFGGVFGLQETYTKLMFMMINGKTCTINLLEQK